MAVIEYIVFALIDLYVLILLVSIIASWLIAFGVINNNNNVVRSILQTCYALTEPALRPIRNLLPNMGGIDISPIILFIALRALKIGLNTYIFYPAMNRGL
ncbi:YggT family protein [Parvularcula sp. LCG005]|uniref:YggT family protein n=1 Tax=Parvularcula sp. LCG005 TaxID=3078805 RepID=UPI0029436E1E|nr:YggT family protein [Parvularcula sp. LCG005]WOI53093.1 YggT family protein [Parvularcula sp. LCG005]